MITHLSARPLIVWNSLGGQGKPAIRPARATYTPNSYLSVSAYLATTTRIRWLLVSVMQVGPGELEIRPPPVTC
jgi:hypothetical protein